jgi:hypothetical protein
MCVTPAVVGAAEGIDEVGGVVGRGLHRGAARPLLAGGGLDQLAIDRVADRQREELAEDGLGGGIQQVVALRAGAGRDHHREHLLGHRRRGQHRVEPGRDDPDRVEAAVGEVLHQAVDERRRVGGRRAVGDVGALHRHLAAHVLEVADALAADDVQRDGEPLPLEPREQRARLLDEVGVERPAEAAVRREQHDRRALRRRRLTEQRVLLRELRRVEVGDDVGEGVGEGARRGHAVLGALHLRRGDHLHRLRDLLRVLHGLDAPAELATLGHCRLRQVGAAQAAATFLYAAMPSFSAASLSFESTFSVRMACPTCG